jgi:hypothetical protein
MGEEEKERKKGRRRRRKGGGEEEEGQEVKALFDLSPHVKWNCTVQMFRRYQCNLPTPPPPHFQLMHCTQNYANYTLLPSVGYLLIFRSESDNYLFFAFAENKLFVNHSLKSTEGQ